MGTSIDYNRKTKRTGWGEVYLNESPLLFYQRNYDLTDYFVNLQSERKRPYIIYRIYSNYSIYRAYSKDPQKKEKTNDTDR